MQEQESLALFVTCMELEVVDIEEKRRRQSEVEFGKRLL
jgi:hypothetical protein